MSPLPLPEREANDHSKSVMNLIWGYQFQFYSLFQGPWPCKEGFLPQLENYSPINAHPRVFKTLMQDRKSSLSNFFTYLSLPDIHSGRGGKADVEKDQEDKERVSSICSFFMRRKAGVWIPVQTLPPWVILEKEVLYEPLSHHLLKKDGGKEIGKRAKMEGPKRWRKEKGSL